MLKNSIDKSEITTCYTASAFCLFIIFLVTGTALISVGAVFLAEGATKVSSDGCYAMIGVGITSLLLSAASCAVALCGVAECCLDIFKY